MRNSEINYHHIEDYDNYGKVRNFESLSCNKNNANEFVAGTYYGGLIFDVRQMKEPFSTFYTTRRRLRSDVPRPCQVSWSPSGKYIYTLAKTPLRGCLRRFGPNGVLDPTLNTGQLCFFWDVKKSERIEMSIDPKTILCRDPQTWIGDNVTLVSSGNIVTVSPHSKSIEKIISCNSNRNVAFSRGDPSYRALEYNDKTRDPLTRTGRS